MVSGLASRGSACTHHRNTYPARVSASRSPASKPSMILPARPHRERLAGRCQSATPARRLIPHLLDAALAVLNAELHDHVDQEVQQVPDLFARKLLARATLLDEQHELLECQFGTRRMNARDRARMAAVHISQV